jgi:MFS family permease
MSVQATRALDNARLSKEHWRVWVLSAMGIFLDGFDLFIIGIALPFINQEFSPSHNLQGFIVAAAPLGCILGATIFGRMTDKLGRKILLLLNILFFVVFAACTAFAWDVSSLILFRFLLGIGIGADYPVSSTYIVENMPKRLRGKMMVSGFGFQALGMITAAITGLVIILIHPEVNAWRIMLGIAVVPAIFIMLMRLTLPESTRWLIHKGDLEKASAAASKMTGKNIKIDAIEASSEASFVDLFMPRYIKRTILTAGSWFIMDVVFYGINFFLPIILGYMAFAGHAGFAAKDIAAIKGDAFTDIFLVIGIFVAIMLVDTWGRVKLQAVGFIGMAVGFFLVASAHFFGADGDTAYIVILFAGFILFNLMVNMGPNPITFLLPAELFPTHIRATGHGFASACGKVGAVVGGILVPVLIFSIGIPETMLLAGILCLVGFLLTAMLGYETKGKSLDQISNLQKTMTDAEVALLNVQRDIQKLNTDMKHVEAALTKAIERMRNMQQP